MEKEVMTFNTDSAMDIKAIPSELFHKKKDNENLHDQAFETKPVSYLKGAMMRFAKNKASIVAAIIIGVRVLPGLLDHGEEPNPGDTGYSSSSSTLGSLTVMGRSLAMLLQNVATALL